MRLEGALPHVPMTPLLFRFLICIRRVLGMASRSTRSGRIRNHEKHHCFYLLFNAFARLPCSPDWGQLSWEIGVNAQKRRGAMRDSLYEGHLEFFDVNSKLAVSALSCKHHSQKVGGSCSLVCDALVHAAWRKKEGLIVRNIWFSYRGHN